MSYLFNYIHWSPQLEAFSFGPFSIRWYSLCWLIGLVLAYLIVRKLFYDQDIAIRKKRVKGKWEEENLFEPLFIYCFLGILIGARLGHCLFYQPDYFLSSGKHFIEMLLPIHYLPNGDWKFTGYEGLASHGGTIGIMIALWLYAKWSKLPILTIIDNICIATPVTACFIRLGNLMNSEIIGKVTDVPWAFIFERVDMLPRHPGQLYEAIAYAIFFFIGWYFYKKKPERVGTGFFFGLCLTLIFTFRFFIEYTKDIQEDFEAGMLLNMGQILSIPFIIFGIWLIVKSFKKMKK